MQQEPLHPSLRKGYSIRLGRPKVWGDQQSRVHSQGTLPDVRPPHTMNGK